MNRKVLAVLMAGLLGGMAPGCVPERGGEAEASRHATPPQSLPDFPRAVEAAERRFSALVDGSPQNPAERLQHLQELIEVVRWLPYLAGDSELPEEAWVRVERASRRLEHRFHQQWQLLRQTRQPEGGARYDDVQAELRLLRQIAASAFPQAVRDAGPPGERQP